MPKKSNTRGATPVFRLPKKAKQVPGNTTKLKKLAELKKVSGQLDKLFKPDRNKDKKMDQLFKKKDKLRQQLGID